MNNPNYLLNGHHSQRLDFRLQQPEDFDLWEPLFHDEAARRFLAFEPDMKPRAMAERWFKLVFDRYKNGTGGMNELIERSTGTLVGMCGLMIQTVAGKERLEIGYAVLPEHRGKGIATEAARYCRDVAFEYNYRDHLISIIHIENTASMQVARNNGMYLELENVLYKGIPAHVFRIDRAEWLARKTN